MHHFMTMRRFFSFLLIVAFSFTTLFPVRSYASSISQNNILSLTPSYMPLMVKGMTVYPEDPFQFDFIVDTGKSGLAGQALNDEAMKMIKYFLAALTVPEKEMWVNLSPVEKDRIVPDGFGQTDMGRDLLAQDYILKQLTASLMYPEGETGKKFWSKIYAQVQSKFRNANMPVNTFNKVWILPETATVYEHGNQAYVVSSRLKVMLDSDYKAMQALGGKNTAIADGQAKLTKDIIKQVIVPAIEKEVNEGEHFALLRQMYTTMILASWYKNKLKGSLLGQAYADKNKIAGIDIADKQAKEKIYRSYVETFKKGVYNYIREERDPATGTTVPRKYFSGGANMDFAMINGVRVTTNPVDAAAVAQAVGAPLTIRWAGAPDMAQTADQWPVALLYGDHGKVNIPKLSLPSAQRRTVVGGKGDGLFEMSSDETAARFADFLKDLGPRNRVSEYIRKNFKGKVRDVLLAKVQSQKFLKNTKIQVPAGFTITTEQTGKWDLLMQQGKEQVNRELGKLQDFLKTEGIDVEQEKIDTDLLKGLTADLAKTLFEYLSIVENTKGNKLGATEGLPFLTAVRSGARESMPGMMDTILNLGLNEKSVLALEQATNAKFAWDSYRRFYEMFSRTVLGIEEDEKRGTGFKYILEHMVKEKEAKTGSSKLTEYDLDAEEHKELIRRYQRELERQSKKLGRPMVVPQNPRLQYLMAIQTVMRSTFNERAMEYRRRQHLKVEDTLSAVNIVPMVFGNRNDGSGSGVFFTRDLRTGEKTFNLEFAFNAQGEDVVSGRKAGRSLQVMLADPKSQDVALKLVLIGSFLEQKYGNVQDIEFTFEHNDATDETSLYILQTRNAKRTAMADVRAAYEMAQEEMAREKAKGTLSQSVEKAIKEKFVGRIAAEALGDLLVDRFDPAAKKKAIAEGKLISHTGLNASPGAGVGRIVLDAKTAEEWNKRGEKVILVREETSPEDLGGMLAAKAILTTRGGRTSHAAVVARQFGIPAVVSIADMQIDFLARTVRIFIQEPDKSTREFVFKEGDYLAVDGTGEGEHGQIFKVSSEEEIPMIPSIIITKQNRDEGIPIARSKIALLQQWINALGISAHDQSLKREYQKYIKVYEDFIGKYQGKAITAEEEEFYRQYRQLRDWANEIRKAKNALGVGANAEEPEDILNAVLNGTERVGLVRTEHMFKGEDRLLLVQKMMVSSGEERRRDLENLLPSQQADFEQIFLLLEGRPATIRLIDPPLHEFLPKKDEDFDKLARFILKAGAAEDVVRKKIKELKEQVDLYKEENPMIGTRGVRLSVLIPEIIEMQAKAIFNAMQRVHAAGIKAKPEIMVPLVGNVEEFKFVRDRIVELGRSMGVVRAQYKVGTMIEIIAGAENAADIAKEAEFFSYGTNDLTQTTLGLSRDDGKKFLEIARLTGVFESDPFVSMIPEVAKFMERATLEARAVLEKRMDTAFSFGVCGEQGVDVKSIKDFLHKYLDYVSGNALRLPGAIFASAQVALAGKTRLAGKEKRAVAIPMKEYGPVNSIGDSRSFQEQVEAAVRYVEKNNGSLSAKKIALAQIRFPEKLEDLEQLMKDREFLEGKAFKQILSWAQELTRRPGKVKEGTRMALETLTGWVTGPQRNVSDGVGIVTTEGALLTNFNVSSKIQEYLVAIAGSTRDKKKEDQVLSDLRRFLRQAMFDVLGEAGRQQDISVQFPVMSLHSIFEYGNIEQNKEAIVRLSGELGIPEEEVRERVRKYEESNPKIGQLGSRIFFTEAAPLYITLAQSMIMAAQERGYGTINLILPFVNNSKQIAVIKKGAKDPDGNVLVPSLNDAVQETIERINAGVNDDKRIKVRLGAVIEVPSAVLDADEISKQVDGPVFVNADNLTMTVWASVAKDVSRPTGFLDAYLKIGLWTKDIFRFASPEIRNLVIEAVQSIKARNPGHEVALIAGNPLDLELLQAAQFARVDSVVFPYNEDSPQSMQFAAIAASAAAATVGVPDIVADKAALAKPENDLGGIDLNAGLLNMAIKRDGKGMPLPASLQPRELINIRGLRPVIINIQSVNVPQLLGLAPAPRKEKSKEMMAIAS